MASSSIVSGAGLRHVRVYTLNASGLVSGSPSGSDGYAGVRVQGVKSFQSNTPDVQPIKHTGDDRVFAQDHLPPTELETATLTTGKTNFTLDAILSNTLVETLGEWQIIGRGTDQQGYESQVMIMGFRQALNTDDDSASKGARQYKTVIYPSARVSPKGGAMSEGATDENSYNVTPTVTNKFPFGKDFTPATNGFEETIKLELTSDNPLMLEQFVGNGSIVNFLLDYTPISVAKTKAFDEDGNALTVSSVNTASKFVTLSAAPSASTLVFIIYEASDMN